MELAINANDPRSSDPKCSIQDQSNTTSLDVRANEASGSNRGKH